MYSRGRPSDQAFRSWHWLYRRCTQEEIAGNRVLPAAIRYNNTSVNWSKYSRPWDVIFDHQGWGIARFVVKDMPKELPKEGDGKPHSFYPAHVPLAENFSHSEIWTLKEGKRVEGKLPSMVKKEFRQIMSDRSLVVSRPEV